MTLGSMADEQQDISGKIQRFERASRKSEKRVPEGKAKWKDANDNITWEQETKQESIGKKIQEMEARLGCIDEEKSPKDIEKPRSPGGVSEIKHAKSFSNENLMVVGSPELRRKLSSHFLRKSSAPSLLGSVPDESRNSKLHVQHARDDVPLVFVFPSEKTKETEDGQHGEKEGDKEGEEVEGGQSSGKEEGKGRSSRFARSVRRVKSMRFSRREKKSHDTEANKGNNEDSVNGEVKGIEDQDKSQVSVIVSTSPSENPANKEMVRELSSFKFSGPRPTDEHGLRKSKSDPACPDISFMASTNKPADVGEGKKVFAALRPNNRRNPKTILPSPPTMPSSPRQATNSIHEYDLISMADSGFPGVPATKSDTEQDKEPLNTTIIKKETPVYATLCPSDEEDESSSDADPANLTNTKFNDTALPAQLAMNKKFADHVYEDIDKVMTNVKKLQATVIGAYQVSDLAHRDIETVKPVVYDEPQASGIDSSKSISPSYTPSRENSWNSGGDGVVKNPAVSRNNWAHRLPSDSTPQSYDVPQTGPTGSQKSLLGSERGGSTPHSPTTAVPPQDDQNVPRGWRMEQTITRDPVFINEVTSEKWYKAVPTDGEPYYYSEDRSQTRWDLPAVASSPRHRMVSDGVGRGDDPKVPSQQLRAGKISQGRPHSFHPHLRSSSPSLPSESRLFDNPSQPVTDQRISVYGNPSPYDMEVREKEGMLTMMLMKDRGRQKKGRPGYAVLAGSQLKYYKDHKNFERDASNPEVSLNLWRTEVGWTRSRTPGKKLIFELSTDQGIYLVQGEDETTSQSWYEAIKGAVAGRTGTSTSPDDNDDNLSPLTPSPGFSPPSNDVHAMKKNNSKIRGKLKIFFNSRPDKDDLRRKGILQEENVFGKDIRKLCEKERSTVPNFVNQCIKYIDRRGLECDGIYRVSGNLSLIQKLRFQVDQEKPVDLDSTPWKDDIHVITGALKLYFRELPEPLFTFSTFDKFIASITQIPILDQKILAFRALFSEMPRVNQDTIFTLFSHLKRVMDNVQHNRMPAKNLATVFGPTLMWPERESMNMTMATVYQNQVMEFVLLEFDNIFRS
ncbi:rho GTPase-activating protein 27-like isoform X2 [Lytechinus variegatus]|uniref:rho GTPase-activating protein 27-like isoform X2 n=1 Tax=Lytechinus variegatus TaxID=7654 RepID=UPI001BB2B801|nr:rho GTPase-activating protein 27-like isoform X2 [Lytechinus variegatus]